MSTTAISIYKKAVDNKTGKDYNQTIRKVNVSSQFEGFGKGGKIILAKFDELVKDLEPSSSGWMFLN